jgi:hypothetical protein
LATDRTLGRADLNRLALLLVMTRTGIANRERAV